MITETATHPEDIYLSGQPTTSKTSFCGTRKKQGIIKMTGQIGKRTKQRFQIFKYITCEMKNSMEQLNRVDTAGKKIYKLEDRFERIQHRKRNGKITSGNLYYLIQDLL